MLALHTLAVCRSELAASLKIYPQVLENVCAMDKKAAQNAPAVQEVVSSVAGSLRYSASLPVSVSHWPIPRH